MNRGQKKTSSLLFIFHETERTGASIALLRYVKWLSLHSGYGLSFLLIFGGGPLEDELKKLGPIFYFGEYTYPVKPGLMQRVVNKITGRMVFSNPQINSLKEAGFDAVIANTLIAAPVIVEIKTFLNVPIGWYLHELELAEKKINRNYTSVIPLIDLWIANSTSTAAFISRKFGISETNCRINYPPVELPELMPVTSLPGNWQGKFIVGTAGSATPRKGCDLFIMIAYWFKKQYPQKALHFVWVGDTRYFADDIEYDLQRLGIENIEFTGQSNEPFNYYQHFDVFVSTSKEESFGLACVECAALGKPVMGFRGTSELERIIRGCKGVLVDYMNIDAMAYSLEKISERPDLLDSMRKGSLEFASGFTGEKPYSDFVNTIETLLEKEMS